MLADAAATGGSPLELTSRGSLQVRGLTAEGADRLAATLSALGGDGALLDAQGRDVPCSVVASPSGLLDDAARAVADALRGRTDVPGRLLVALDDGAGDVAALDGDVTVVDGALVLAGTPTDLTGDARRPRPRRRRGVPRGPGQRLARGRGGARAGPRGRYALVIAR